MNKVILFILSIVYLTSCKKDNTDVIPEDLTKIERKITGEWLSTEGGAGGNNYQSIDSPKNFQYTFEVSSNNQSVDITLSSSVIDVQYALFDPLGQRIDLSYANRTFNKNYTLNAGKYRLVICAERKAVGKFTLILKGVKASPELINFQKLQSGTQNWGPLGGGGFINYLYTYKKTLKNHFYTFDIIEDNATIDVELESPDVDVALVLYDELGQYLGYIPRGYRYVYKIEATKKGTYTAVICTEDRGAIGNYNFRAFGKISNLQRVPSQSVTTKGAWTAGSQKDTYGYAYDSYTVEVTGNATPLDIELFSSDAFVELYLESSSGVSIDYNVQSFLENKIYTFISPDLPKGTYRIIAHSHRGGYGNYTMNVFGQFANFRKE
ncbi:hypothetical protein [Flectobacillus longus]|uniref:hypothetical protein n=1 Tax=Flectobacillus longus TaxID=2984207 RepID=UPI0024B63A4D|nr:hypothetical protein [Flectobacillus longus]MDI9878280.1 hypothetical protein [Flectobacillus longus]